MSATELLAGDPSPTMRSASARSVRQAAREAIRRNPCRSASHGRKVVGGTTVGLGVVLVPAGPGALIALGGLAILGTESPRAKRLDQQGVALAKKAAAAARARREARRAQEPLRETGRTERPPRA